MTEPVTKAGRSLLTDFEAEFGRRDPIAERIAAIEREAEARVRERLAYPLALLERMLVVAHDQHPTRMVEVTDTLLEHEVVRPLRAALAPPTESPDVDQK